MLGSLKNKKGFTLLELVVTMGFFAVVSMGVMSLLIQNMKLVSYTQTQASGMTIALNKWSQLLSAPYSSVVNEPRTVLGDGHDREVVVSEQILPDNSKQKNVKITVFKTGGDSIYSLNEIKSQVGIEAGEKTPTGFVGYFWRNDCPSGWLEANGQTGTIDLRGEFIRSLDQGRGVDPGRTIATWQKGSLYTGEDFGNTVNSPVINSNPAQYGLDYANVNSYPGVAVSFVVATGSGYIPQSHVGMTRPRNVALLTCIKQ